jgi:hypothetical protein
VRSIGQSLPAVGLMDDAFDPRWMTVTESLSNSQEA